jgi:hypothetical protein
MEALNAGPLARALEAGRARYNALFAQARHATPTLDAAAFAEQLRLTVAPVVDRVAGAVPDRVEEVAGVLYELALDLTAKELWRRYPVLAEGWRVLLGGLPRHLAAAPRVFAGSVTNALYNLAQTPGARPGEWQTLLLELGKQCLEPARLLEAGKVLAWRAGLAHFRAGALAMCRGLDADVARAALGLEDAAVPLDDVLRRLQADPWLSPAAAGKDPGGRHELRLVAAAGGFRGFGGPFLRPPRVACVDGAFLAGDGESCWVLAADVFGATFHRTDAALPPAAAPAGFRIDRNGKVTRGKRTRAFDELQEWTSAATSATTLAVTVPLSHRVYLVALV